MENNFFFMKGDTEWGYSALEKEGNVKYQKNLLIIKITKRGHYNTITKDKKKKKKKKKNGHEQSCHLVPEVLIDPPFIRKEG